MLVKRIAACAHLSSTVYELYSEILVGNCNFSYPLAFNAPVGVIPLDDLRDFWWVSCRMARHMVQKYPRKVKPPE